MIPIESQLNGLLLELCRALVTQPEAVTVRTELLHRTIEANIEVAPQDFGLVIGKGGKTFMALKQFCRIIAQKHGFNSRINRMIEPPERVIGRDLGTARDWATLAETLILRIAIACFADADAIEVTSEKLQGRIRFSLGVNRNESAILVSMVQEHLDHLIGAIARGSGGNANVDIRIKEPEQAAKQPPSAAGRFSKEI